MLDQVKVNPWLARKLRQVRLGPELLSLIIRIDLNKKADVEAALRRIPNLRIVTEVFDYINVEAPPEAIPNMEAIPGVIQIHYNMPKRTLQLPSDLTKALSQIPLFKPLFDPLLGQIKLDPIVMPYLSPESFLPFGFIKSMTVQNSRYIPVSATKQILLDVQNHGLTGKGVKVAVLDTGIFSLHPQIRMKAKELTTRYFPLGVDDNGHGTWCNCTINGDPWQALFGLTDGMAPEAQLISVKVLGYAVGTGTVMGILAGMQAALDNGAKIVSMSLGSEECQGGCGDPDGGPCPECRTIKQLTDQGMIFSIAAGNSGPGDMTIGCPGCSPSGISVASHSYSDGQVSWFSSRGPQTKANASMPITDFTLKPDVASYGGGRALQDTTPDEVLYNGCFALLDGMYSGIKQMAEGLKGTSMATPHFAGLLALLVEKGVVNSAADVKKLLAKSGHPKTKEDGYGLAKLSWFY